MRNMNLVIMSCYLVNWSQRGQRSIAAHFQAILPCFTISSSSNAAAKLPHPVSIQGIPDENPFVALHGPFAFGISLQLEPRTPYALPATAITLVKRQRECQWNETAVTLEIYCPIVLFFLPRSY